MGGGHFVCEDTNDGDCLFSSGFFGLSLEEIQINLLYNLSAKSIFLTFSPNKTVYNIMRNLR